MLTNVDMGEQMSDLTKRIALEKEIKRLEASWDRLNEIRNEQIENLNASRRIVRALRREIVRNFCWFAW